MLILIELALDRKTKHSTWQHPGMLTDMSDCFREGVLLFIKHDHFPVQCQYSSLVSVALPCEAHTLSLGVSYTGLLDFIAKVLGFLKYFLFILLTFFTWSCFVHCISYSTQIILCGCYSLQGLIDLWPLSSFLQNVSKEGEKDWAGRENEFCSPAYWSEETHSQMFCYIGT